MKELDVFRRNLALRHLGPSWGGLQSEFDRITEEFDRVFGPSISTRQREFMPSCDIQETKDNYLLSFDIPGINKNDISVELIGNQLTVSGERKHESKEDNEFMRRSERYYGNFCRSFTLPDGTHTDKMEAVYENGVLAVVVPKSDKIKPMKISIKEGEGGFVKKILNKMHSGEIEDSKHVK